MPGVLILTQSPTRVGDARHNVRFLLINFKRWRPVGRHLCVLLVQVQRIVFHGIREEALFFLKYLGLGPVSRCPVVPSPCPFPLSDAFS